MPYFVIWVVSLSTLNFSAKSLFSINKFLKFNDTNFYKNKNIKISK